MLRKENIIKTICVSVFGIFILFIHLQYLFNVVDTSSLKVSVTHDYHMPFNLKDWVKGRYQINSDRYFKENFGFREIAVRSYNQVDYSIFNEANAKSVIIGKHGYLYEENYINSYLGTNFVGVDSIKKQVQILKKLQDSLANSGITLLPAIAPGKGHFYPEYIPDRYGHPNDSTNYTSYISYLEKEDIKYIDFNKYFLSLKPKTEHPLYSKNGTHWSYFGLCLASDSLLSFINRHTRFNIPQIHWINTEIDVERPYDYDIAKGMNLLSNLDGDSMAYPKIKLEATDSSHYKPRTLVIGDSHYWGMFNLGVSQAFANNAFWYYNRQVLPESYEHPLFVDQLDLKEEVNDKDVIIILGTVGGLHNFSWGFLNSLDKHY